MITMIELTTFDKREPITVVAENITWMRDSDSDDVGAIIFCHS